MNVKQAKSIRIDVYLERLGFLPARKSGSSLMYSSMLSPSGDRTPSFEVSSDGHAFHDWSSGFSGSIIDLALALCGTNNISNALASIQASMDAAFSPHPTASDSFYFHQQKKGIAIHCVQPIRSRALLHYAWTRGIAPQVVRAYCSEIHYFISDRERYAIGWRNNSGGWELRNSFAKLAASPKDCTLVNDLCECTMLVFEGFFDFLSAVQLGWFRPETMNAVVLNSTALVRRAIPLLEHAARVICLLDNDEAGRSATAALMQALPCAEDKACLYVGGNDLNEWMVMNKININNI